jgi:hypothetical protein
MMRYHEKRDFMAKAFKHFKTITHHRHQVILNCFRAGIPWQGLKHDLSKYSWTEFSEGARYWQGHRSPNDREREIKGYSESWMHHKGRNRHHFEYWTDYDKITKRMKGVKMPRKYLIEMFCDRVAASKIYNKDKYTDSKPLEYFQQARDNRISVINEETSDEIGYLLQMLADKGEKETFRYIRKIRRKGNVVKGE